MTGVSDPFVPVSTAGAHESKTEIKNQSFGHDSTVPHAYVLADAINCLVDAGYQLGCDGELLPPLWVRKEQAGADA